MEVVDDSVVLGGAEVTYATLVWQLCLYMVMMHVKDQRSAVAVRLSTDETGQTSAFVCFVHVVLHGHLRQEVLQQEDKIRF